jgi:hypothetical protein
MRTLSAVILAGVTALAACRENPLDIENTDNPDVLRVFGAPKDVETIISRIFQQLYNGQHGTFTSAQVQTLSWSFESHSQLGNNGMGTRAAIPRAPVDNSIGNGDAGNGFFRDFDHLSRNARGAANAIAALDRFFAAGATVGTPARNARAKSFAYFALGYATGQLAMLYDSAAIVTAATPTDEIPPLSSAADVSAAALIALDSALAISSTAAATTGTDGWPIPAAWVSSPTAAGPDLATWQRIVRSYRAKFRANVARTPAERAAVNWAAVIADATTGITADWVVQADVVGGWQSGWVQQLRVASTWGQMTPFILGMADTTGAYDTWLQMPLASRTAVSAAYPGGQFVLRTPDRRFPSGDTRAAQQAVTGTSKAGPPTGSILYFRNRPTGEDTPAELWGTWFYDNWRNWGIGTTGGNGPFVLLPVAEIDMLAAEGYLRTNQVLLAGPLIDKTRVRAGLPPVTGIGNLTTAVPGGNACVPRTPQPPSFTTTACGNIFEAMKWEKRIETSHVGYAQWFMDSRGWGDLVEATPLEYPVPWQELFARIRPAYTNTNRAARGAYGY